MKIKWHVEMGLQGCHMTGECEVPDDASDEDIEVVVRDDVANFVSWTWRKETT